LDISSERTINTNAKNVRPSQQAARLELWLRLANAVPAHRNDLIPAGRKGPALVSVQPPPKYPREIEQEFVQRFQAQVRSPLRSKVVRRLKEALPSVGFSVAYALRGFARGSHEWFFEQFDDVSIGAGWKDGGGRIYSGFANPRKLFLDDLRGAIVARIRECPVCQSLFYAQREDRACCKPSCANVRRVHIARGSWEVYCRRHFRRV
jgi:hypothetical protein